MYKTIATILVLLCSCFLFGEDLPSYGEHNLRKILVTKTLTDGTEKHALDMKLLDTVLTDLHSHANEYPPKFATREEFLRARSDANVLSNLFEIWLADPKAESDLLLKMARLYTLAHNFDIPKSVTRADVSYKQLLKSAPKDPIAHYMYGSFLAHTGRTDEGIKHLQRSVELKFPAALRNLAMAHLSQGKEEVAIAKLTEYVTEFPKNKKARWMLAEIERGNFQVHSK